MRVSRCWGFRCKFGGVIAVCYTESYSKLVLLSPHDAGASKLFTEPSACEISPLSAREVCKVAGKEWPES